VVFRRGEWSPPKSAQKLESLHHRDWDEAPRCGGGSMVSRNMGKHEWVETAHQRRWRKRRSRQDPTRAGQKARLREHSTADNSGNALIGGLFKSWSIDQAGASIKRRTVRNVAEAESTNAMGGDAPRMKSPTRKCLISPSGRRTQLHKWLGNLLHRGMGVSENGRSFGGQSASGRRRSNTEPAWTHLDLQLTDKGAC